MRVLVVCYQIERGKGSESGSGYNFVANLRRLGHDITLITRPNNAEPLRGDADLDGITVVGYDPPSWVTRLKRGNRGVIGFYYVWQKGVGRLAAALHRATPFDVIHQYNFHTDWAPHFLQVPDARVIWGPICHQPALPVSYLRLEPLRGLVREAAKALTKRVFWNLDPNLRRAIAASDVILFANDDVPATFARSGKVRLQTFGGALAGQESRDSDPAGPFQLLHVGRAVSIKGASVALDAVCAATARGVDVALTVVGDGPMQKRLEGHANALGIFDRVRFVPWVDPEELRDEYARADAFLYPSLGNQDTVVAEALAASLPVIGVAGSGTHAMAAEAGSWASRGPRRRLIDDLSALIADLAVEARTDPAAWRRRRSLAGDRSRVLSWSTTAQRIAETYSTA